MIRDALSTPTQLLEILDECRQSLSNLANTRDDALPNWLGTHTSRAAVKAARALIVAADSRIGEWGDLPHILQWHRDPNREPAHIRTKTEDGQVWEAEVTEIKIGSGFNADGSLPDDTALCFWVQFLCPFLRSHTRVLPSASGAYDFLDRSGDDQAAATERLRAQASDWSDCCRIAGEIVREHTQQPGAGPTIPIVFSNPQSAAIEWNGVRHPVRHNVADAFQKMIDAKGQPIGLTAILGDKPTRILPGLSTELQDLIRRADGNKGYYLAVFNVPNVGPISP